MTQEHEEQHAGMSESEMRDNLVRLVFEGNSNELDRFCGELVQALPPETAAVLRGSSITGQSHEGDPFDAEGPGSSDLDLTLVGGEVLHWFEPERDTMELALLAYPGLSSHRQSSSPTAGKVTGHAASTLSVSRSSTRSNPCSRRPRPA